MDSIPTPDTAATEEHMRNRCITLAPHQTTGTDKDTQSLTQDLDPVCVGGQGLAVLLQATEDQATLVFKPLGQNQEYAGDNTRAPLTWWIFDHAKRSIKPAKLSGLFARSP